MTIPGDPDELERLADALVARAGQVRQHAADHQRQGYAARWVSSSADGYRDRVAGDTAACDRAASELEQAAAVLRKHAEQVRHVLALIGEFERAVTDWFTRHASWLENAANAVTEAVGLPPWAGWPVGPHNLPGTGDPRWLEVGRFMRGQGVI